MNEFWNIYREVIINTFVGISNVLIPITLKSGPGTSEIQNLMKPSKTF